MIAQMPCAGQRVTNYRQLYIVKTGRRGAVRAMKRLKHDFCFCSRVIKAFLLDVQLFKFSEDRVEFLEYPGPFGPFLTVT